MLNLVFLPEGRTKGYFPAAALERKQMDYVRRACGSENLYLSLAFLIFLFLLKPLKID